MRSLPANAAAKTVRGEPQRFGINAEVGDHASNIYPPSKPRSNVRHKTDPHDVGINMPLVTSRSSSVSTKLRRAPVTRLPGAPDSNRDFWPYPKRARRA